MEMEQLPGVLWKTILLGGYKITEISSLPKAQRDEIIVNIIGMERVLDRYRGIRVLVRANANWDQANAQQVMLNLLYNYPNIDGVLTQVDFIYAQWYTLNENHKVYRLGD